MSRADPNPYYKMKTKIFNLFRYVFMFKPLEDFLASMTANKEIGTFITKLPPNHYQYKNNSIREVTRNGINYYLDISELIDWSIYWGFKEYARERLYALIKEGGCIVDIGANIGDITHILLKLDCKVISVEPQEVCLQTLYKRFNRNKMVTIVGKAVGDREGQGELAICESANTISTMTDKWKETGRFSKDYKWDKTQTVLITTLDSLILLYGKPDFCKIDVEGFEESVLKGLTKPIQYISFEFTKDFLDDAKKCINHLSAIGKIKVNCSLGASWEFIFPTWVEPDELYKRLQSINDKLLQGDIYIWSTPYVLDKENGL